MFLRIGATDDSVEAAQVGIGINVMNDLLVVSVSTRTNN